MKNKFMTALVSVGLAFTMSTAVIAAPLDDYNKQKSDLQQKQSQNNSQISSVNKQINDLESSIEDYDNQISNMTIKLNDTKSKISGTQAKIEKAQSALKKAQDDYNNQQKLLDDRIKVIYVNGSESYVSFLLDSKGLGDFVSRIETVKQISELDKRVMSDLEAKQDQIKTEKQTLDTQKTQLVKLQSDQQSTIDSLNSKKSQEATVVAQYNTKKASLLATDSQYKAQIDEMNKKIAAAQSTLDKQTSKVDTSGGSSSVHVVDDGTLGSKLVAYAYSLRGKQYVYATQGPDTFDCSGLTMYVYAHFGISIPRVADDQSLSCTRLSRSQLQPGDLVFFGGYDNKLRRVYVHHVGMYAGDGCFIEAPKTGDVVKVSVLDYRSDFVWGGRFR